MIRYDFDGDGRSAPYRNNVNRWLLQARERQTVVFPIWNKRDGARTGTRRVQSWTRWRTVRRLFTQAEALEELERSKRSGLAQWRVTFAGKVVAP